MGGVLEDFDVLIDVVTRPVRVVSSGQVMWGLCTRPPAATGFAAASVAAQCMAGQGARDDLRHQMKLQNDGNCPDDHLGEYRRRDDSDSDNGLVYLPSLMPSSGST